MGYDSYIAAKGSVIAYFHQIWLRTKACQVSQIHTVSNFCAAGSKPFSGCHAKIHNSKAVESRKPEGKRNASRKNWLLSHKIASYVFSQSSHFVIVSRFELVQPMSDLLHPQKNPHIAIQLMIIPFIEQGKSQSLK